MKIFYVIGVQFPEGEARSPRYFDGSTEPGWHGNTVVDIDHARTYHLSGYAIDDIAKLAPRLIGRWVVERVERA